MNIDPLNPLHQPGIQGPAAKPVEPAVNNQGAVGQKADNIERFSQLMQQLRELPEVRPEMVDKARTLLGNEDYPGPDELELLSERLLPMLSPDASLYSGDILAND